jgi:hypothetical protein
MAERKILRYLPSGEPVYERKPQKKDDAWYAEQERIRKTEITAERAARARPRYSISVPSSTMQQAREIGNGNASRGIEIACVSYLSTGVKPKSIARARLLEALARMDAPRRHVARRNWNRKHKGGRRVKK